MFFPSCNLLWLQDAFGSERRKAKMLNFSIAYGKTAVGLSRDWKVLFCSCKYLHLMLMVVKCSYICLMVVGKKQFYLVIFLSEPF